jgi:signal transduction histidine kinase/ActR/RegA family two-component response regulator
VWVSVSISPVKNPNGGINQLVAVVADITDRKHAEEALRKSRAQLAEEAAALTRLHELSSRLWRKNTLREGLDEILAATLELLGADQGNVQIVTESRALTIVTHRGFSDEFLNFFRDVSIEDATCCARAWRSGQRMMIPDVERDPDFEPFRNIARNAGFRAVQSTPLVAGDGTLLGVLSTHWKAVHHPSEHELHWLDLYLAQAVNFIERLRTQEALQASQVQLTTFAGQLEEQVQRRTQELVQSEARLRALATELNLTEQRERQRIAAELHDHLQQILVLGKLKLGKGKHLASAAPAYAAVMREVDDVLGEALRYTRTLVAQLCPPVLRDFGLAASLRWLGEQMRQEQLIVSVEISDRDVSVPEEHSVLLFQSVRELLLNVVKHAAVAFAYVHMQEEGGLLRIEVRDEGKGFDVADIAPPLMPSETPKFGLFSIRERMAALGGVFQLQSSPGKGTSAILLLPVRQEKATSANPSVQDNGQGSEIDSKTGPSINGSQMRDAGTMRVLLVDDHAMVREGLRSVLESYQEVEVVGEASDGEEAVTLVHQLRPTVVVMDINMPRLNGIEATGRIKSRYPEITIIGLSVNADPDNQDAMIAAGADVLLPKEAATAELYRVIQEALKPRMLNVD